MKSISKLNDTSFSQYLLKHNNNNVAALILDDSGSISQCDILNQDLAPFGSKDKKQLNLWWNRRAIPTHQLNQRELLGNNTRLSYMMENLSLSLIDHYWIKPINTSYTWEDVNLYTNSFSEKDMSYSDPCNYSHFKPSATTQGELQKRWIVKNGARYLIKGNYGAMYRQSINEVFASKLHEMQGIPHTNYDLVELPTTLGAGLGCISKDFTDIKTEFIPCYDVVNYGKQPNDVNVFEYYIHICNQFGIPEATMRDYLDYQIMSDYLLTNTDRHLLNLGVLRDSKTLKFLRPAPIFDTGNALFHTVPYNENTILDIPVTSFYKTEEKLMDLVQNRMVLDLNKLPDLSFMDELYSKDPYAVVYLKNLKEGYEKKIEIIDAFQRGYSLHKHSDNFFMNCDLSEDKERE